MMKHLWEQLMAQRDGPQFVFHAPLHFRGRDAFNRDFRPLVPKSRAPNTDANPES